MLSLWWPAPPNYVFLYFFLFLMWLILFMIRLWNSFFWKWLPYHVRNFCSSLSLKQIFSVLDNKVHFLIKLIGAWPVSLVLCLWLCQFRQLRWKAHLHESSNVSFSYLSNILNFICTSCQKYSEFKGFSFTWK